MKKYLTPFITLSLVVFLFPSLVVPDPALAQSNNYCNDFYGNNITSLNQDPAFTAHGFNKVEIPWEEVFGTSPASASSVTVQLPGAFMPETQRQYLAIPFTMTGDQINELRTQVRFSAVEIQMGGVMETHSVSVTISPCPGDFRARNPSLSSPIVDPYLGYGCRFDYSIRINGTISSVNGVSGCPTPKDKKMYLNIATYNMFGSDATLPGGPCGQLPCGVSFRII